MLLIVKYADDFEYSDFEEYNTEVGDTAVLVVEETVAAVEETDVVVEEPVDSGLKKNLRVT
jgi:hypothetical protein